MVRFKAGSALFSQTLKGTNFDKNSNSKESIPIQKSKEISKVDEIKAQIESGNYKVDIEKSAKALAEILARG